MNAENAKIRIAQMDEDSIEITEIDLADLGTIIRVARGQIRPLIVSYADSNTTLFEILEESYQPNRKLGSHKVKDRDWI